MGRVSFFFVVIMGLCGPAAAQDVRFNTPNASDGLRAQLRAASLVVELAGDDASAQDLVAAARADYRRLLTALFSNGYYGPDISITVNGIEASSIAPLDAPSAVNTIVMSVDPGPLFRFSEAVIAPLPPQAVLPEEFRSGARARSDVIRQSAATAITAWRDAGHAKAEVAGQTLRADHAEAALRANIAISPGPLLTFGPVLVEGNEAVRDSAIRRIAGVPEGAQFSPAAIAMAEQRLRASGAFDTANALESETIAAGDQLPITLSVAESKPRRFGFGLELSTIDGLTVSSFWMHRNAFGGAERFRVDGEVSGIGGETGGIDYTLGVSLGVPAIYGPDTNLLASFAISREDEPTYKIDKVSAEVSATRSLSDDLTANIGVGLLHAREETADGTRRYTLLTLPLGLEWDKRDSDIRTKDGYYLDVNLTPFIGLEGIANGARLFADARAYRSFGEGDRVTLAARAMTGSLLGSAPEDAPADFLFFSGGGGTVRGQPYKTLGIMTDSGQRGGTSYLGAQFETRVDVTDAIGLVGFYDFGHIGDTPVPLEDGDWHAGTGFGLRYDTGIGPIRLDLGTPANGDDAFDSLQVYIGIGQAF